MQNTNKFKSGIVIIGLIIALTLLGLDTFSQCSNASYTLDKEYASLAEMLEDSNPGSSYAAGNETNISFEKEITMKLTAGTSYDISIYGDNINIDINGLTMELSKQKHSIIITPENDIEITINAEPLNSSFHTSVQPSKGGISLLSGDWVLFFLTQAG